MRIGDGVCVPVWFIVWMEQQMEHLKYEPGVGLGDGEERERERKDSNGSQFSLSLCLQPVRLRLELVKLNVSSCCWVAVCVGAGVDPPAS